MRVVTPELIKDKRVLLRLDIDVPLIESSVKKFEVADDFRLKAGMQTLMLCLEHAREVIILGHIGRPEGMDPSLSVGPIYDWLGKELGELGMVGVLGNKLKLLENLRFEKGEEDCDLEYAKELASLGDFFVNEAFAAHHPSASTTILPQLLPHAAGLQFIKEVETLKRVRENPEQPLIVIIGGAKIEDKLPAVLQMAKIADKVLVGGKIAGEIRKTQNDPENSERLRKPEDQIIRLSDNPELRCSDAQDLRVILSLSDNVYLANLRDDGKDIKEETVQIWAPFISNAKMILWNGPMGYIEDPKYNQTERISQLVIESNAESIVGGGDTVSYLNYLGDLPMFSFVSTGGGAMLEYLVKGTLPTIEALN